MSKLITVRCTFDYVVVVDDNANIAEAHVLAEDCVRDALYDLSSDQIDFELFPYKDVKPSGWDDECIPYGGDGNTRTGEYLK